MFAPLCSPFKVYLCPTSLTSLACWSTEQKQPGPKPSPCDSCCDWGPSTDVSQSALWHLYSYAASGFLFSHSLYFCLSSLSVSSVQRAIQEAPVWGNRSHHNETVSGEYHELQQLSFPTKPYLQEKVDKISTKHILTDNDPFFFGTFYFVGL